METFIAEIGMEFRGHIENGRIVLDEPTELPDGTVVRVEPVRKRRGRPGRRAAKATPTLFERLKRFAGKAPGLPRDAARNLDHHLYGLAKRK